MWQKCNAGSNAGVCDGWPASFSVDALVAISLDKLG